MALLQTSDPNALKLLFTEEIYLIDQIPKDETADLETKSAPEFNYLGENNSFFLVLLEEDSEEIIAKNNLSTLLKIMQGKSLELKDLAIVNITNNPGASFETLKDFFACSKIALFGIPPASIGLPPIQANQPEKHDGVKILTTYSIEEMLNDVAKKKEFWAVMKNF